MAQTRDHQPRGLRRRLSGALVACLLLPACGVDVGDPVSGGGGGGRQEDVPEQVIAAFERSCVPGCHDSSQRLASLSLERGALGGVLEANSTLDSTLPLVKIGDLEGSMLAIKVMDPETLALYGIDRPGGQMPAADLAGPDASLEDSAVILAWIAGAKFPDESGGTGDTGGATWDDWED